MLNNYIFTLISISNFGKTDYPKINADKFYIFTCLYPSLSSGSQINKF